MFIKTSLVILLVHLALTRASDPEEDHHHAGQAKKSAFKGGPTSADEYNLRAELTSRADPIRKQMRPIAGDLSQAVPLWHGLSLINIMDADETTGKFSFHTFTQMRWKDESMTWSPEAHNGINSLMIDTDNMWNPDFMLYNSIKSEVEESQWVKRILYADGTVMFIPNSYYTVFCSKGGNKGADWTCKLKFGSWVYASDAVDLQKTEEDNIDMTAYEESPLWEIVDHSSAVEKKKYDCCEELYASITYSFALKRK